MQLIFGCLLNYLIANTAFLLEINSINYLKPIYKDSNLSQSEIYYQNEGSIIIMGHSGSGAAAVFNEIPKLDYGNDIYLHFFDKKNKYLVSDKKLIVKSTPVELENAENTLYLVTCDLNNFNYQWLITAKKIEER